MIVAHEASGRRAVSVDPEAVRAALLDSISWWSAKARTEAIPSDRLWICFSCSSCGAVFDRVLRCPEIQDDDARIYRGVGDVDRTLDDLLGARPRFVDPSEWKSASVCVCGAPHHLRTTAAAGLFHTVIGGGAGLAVARIDGMTTWLRCPDGSGALETIDPSSFREAFGRPLTLFDPWSDVILKLPLHPGTVVGTPAEPGVFLFAAADRAALDHGIRAKLGAKGRVVVDIEPTTVEGAAWPARLLLLARAIEEGARAAVVVERGAMLAQARAFARGILGGDVRSGPRDAWMLATEKGEWPVLPMRIALAMAARGHTLGEATAHELTQAAREIEDRIATLTALTAIVPGSSFDVEGSTATARVVDGRPARTIELSDIPHGANALGPEVLAREAAFLFDVAPPWADRSRVCPCGAALAIESRLVSWPWAGPESARPRVVRVLADEGRPGAALVVALACDRHVRIPPERELAQLGIDDARLATYLDADVARTRIRVRSSSWNSADGDRIMAVRAPFVSAVVLSDGRARALHDALGRPQRTDSVAGWAIGSHVALLAPAGASEALVGRALAELGIPSAEPFWLRRELDLNAPAVGSFDVAVDRR